MPQITVLVYCKGMVHSAFDRYGEYLTSNILFIKYNFSRDIYHLSWETDEVLSICLIL